MSGFQYGRAPFNQEAAPDDEALAREHYRVIHSRLMRLATILERKNLTTAWARVQMAAAALEDSEDAFLEGVDVMRLIEDAYAIGEEGL